MVLSSPFAELDPAVLYGILRLRVDVFVVEQECAYPELDGRDAEPRTVHYWIADESGTPIATLRVLADQSPDGDRYRIGRVCAASEHRGTGLIRALMDAAVAGIGTAPSVLDAQAHLAGMYERWGYAAAGPEFMEDGIPHLPMARPAAG